MPIVSAAVPQHRAVEVVDVLHAREDLLPGVPLQGRTPHLLLPIGVEIQLLESAHKRNGYAPERVPDAGWFGKQFVR